jgi:hypothetical protein
VNLFQLCEQSFLIHYRLNGSHLPKTKQVRRLVPVRFDKKISREQRDLRNADFPTNQRTALGAGQKKSKTGAIEKTR